jgi:transcription elongation factor SPT6
MADFVDGAAEVASQESDYDSETGETRHRENGAAALADSSEEEESEDEEAALAVRITHISRANF